LDQKTKLKITRPETGRISLSWQSKSNTLCPYSLQWFPKALITWTLYCQILQQHLNSTKFLMIWRYNDVLFSLLHCSVIVLDCLHERLIGELVVHVFRGDLMNRGYQSYSLGNLSSSCFSSGYASSIRVLSTNNALGLRFCRLSPLYMHRMGFIHTNSLLGGGILFACW
jgi:hypothetical protein